MLNHSHSEIHTWLSLCWFDSMQVGLSGVDPSQKDLHQTTRGLEEREIISRLLWTHPLFRSCHAVTVHTNKLSSYPFKVSRIVVPHHIQKWNKMFAKVIWHSPLQSVSLKQPLHVSFKLTVQSCEFTCVPSDRAYPSAFSKGGKKPLFFSTDALGLWFQCKKIEFCE